MADLSRAERDARGRKLRVLHVITGLDAGGAEGMLSALLTARDAPDLEQAAVSLTPGGEETFLEEGDEIKITSDAVVLEQIIGQFLYNKAAETPENK